MASQPPRSSQTPAGVPSSGSGKYVIVALLLLGVIGGAVAWKLSQSPPPPPVVVIDAAAPPPTNTGRNPDDDVPPPPPVEDAGSDAGKKTVAVGSSNGCNQKCTGGTSPELEQALAFRMRQAHRCYDNALAQDPTLRGKIVVSLKIGTNGSVCSAGIASNEMGSQNVASCVTNQFRNANFPAPKGGCVDLNVPANFVPHQ